MARSVGTRKGPGSRLLQAFQSLNIDVPSCYLHESLGKYKRVDRPHPFGLTLVHHHLKLSCPVTTRTAPIPAIKQGNKTASCSPTHPIAALYIHHIAIRSLWSPTTDHYISKLRDPALNPPNFIYTLICSSISSELSHSCSNTTYFHISTLHPAVTMHCYCANYYVSPSPICLLASSSSSNTNSFGLQSAVNCHNKVSQFGERCRLCTVCSTISSSISYSSQK